MRGPLVFALWLVSTASIAAGLLFGGGTAPQNEPTKADNPLVLRFDVNLVQMDVVVTDSRGRRITDLGPEDFQVFQDGKPQKITHFSFIQEGASAAPAAPAPDARQASAGVAPAIAPQLERGEVHRTIVLFVNDTFVDPCAIETVNQFLGIRLAVKKFIYEEIQPGDLVALVRASGESGALQQFTSDPQLLRYAVDNMWRWLPPCVEGAKAGRSAVAMRQVINALAAMPGRKALIHIGPGMPSGAIARALADTANRSSVTVHAVYNEGLKTFASTAADRSPPVTSRPEIINSVPSVLLSRPTQADYFRPNDLAQWTGGLTWRQNWMDLGIKEAVDDSVGYYLIGWYPGTEAFDKRKAAPDYHPVQIKVRRQGLTVRTRDGFFGTPGIRGPDEGKSAEAQMAEALFSPFRSGALDVRLTASFQQNKELGPHLESLLHVGSRGIEFQEDAKGCRTANLEILTWPLPLDPNISSQGKAASRLAAFQFCGKTLERVLKDGIVCLVRDKIAKPGPYQVRVAVRNAVPGSGHSMGSTELGKPEGPAGSVAVGAASRFLDTPDIEKRGLVLSGIMLGIDNAPAFAATQSGAAEMYRPAAEGDPAVRSFRAGDTLRYDLHLFRAKGASSRATMETRIRVFREGQEVYTGAPASLDPKGADPVQGMPVQGTYKLEAAAVLGQYMLGVIATERQGSQQRTAQQWIDFEVVE